MYYTMRNFKKAFQDIVMSRRAIRNMNTYYPDATPDELAAADNVCIICREEMVSASKKLPCNHIFHTACLRSWFQRQQTCPTCRLNILRPATNVNDARGQNQAGQQGGPPAAATPQQQQQQVPTVNVNNNPDGPRPEQLTGLRGIGQTVPSPFTIDGMPQFFAPPPFQTVVPLPPVPTPPPNLTALTDDELRSMEGNLRSAVEARIQTLQRVQLLIDAANIMMNQYQTVAATTTPNIPMSTMPRSATMSNNKTNETKIDDKKLNTNVVDDDEKTNDMLTGKLNNSDISCKTLDKNNTMINKNNNEPGTSTAAQAHDYGDDDDDDNDEAAVLRRKRLQKFTAPQATEEQ